MRSKGRTILVVCIAALAFSAVASASAMASASWKINGSGLSGKETLNTTTGPLKLSFGYAKSTLVVECASSTSSGAEIFNTNEGSVAKLSLQGCKMTEPSSCSVDSAIVTKAINTKIFDVGTEEVWEELSPAPAGTELFKLGITGCFLEGEYKIRGCTVAKMIEPNVEAVTKGFEFVGALPTAVENATGCTGMKLGEEPATLKGAGTSTLSGANKGNRWMSHF